MRMGAGDTVLVLVQTSAGLWLLCGCELDALFHGGQEGVVQSLQDTRYNIHRAETDTIHTEQRQTEHRQQSRGRHTRAETDIRTEQRHIHRARIDTQQRQKSDTQSLQLTHYTLAVSAAQPAVDWETA